MDLSFWYRETINGKKFTLDEYLQVETAYINSVNKFKEESSIDSLRILQLERDEKAIVSGIVFFQSC